MPRRFSSYPGGRLGAGLLLLRTAIGVVLIVQGSTWLAGRAPVPWPWATGSLALALGALLLLGFLTPVAAALAALGSLGIALAGLPRGLTECPPAAFFVLVM